MYNKILEHLTTGCRALIAAVLLIAGIIWQAAAGKLLDQTAFYLMAAAMLCFATVIFTKCKPDMIQYVIGNMIVLIMVSSSENPTPSTEQYCIPFGLCVSSPTGG